MKTNLSKNKYNIFTYLFLLLAITAVLPAVFAENDGTQKKTPEEIEAYKEKMRAEKQPYIEQYKEELKQSKEQIKKDIIAKKCDTISSKIEMALQNYDERNSAKEQFSRNLNEKLTRFIATAQAYDIDTSKLESDVQTMEELISNLKTANDNYVTAIKSSKTYLCAENEGSYSQSVQEAQQLREQIRTAFSQLKDFYITTLKADIQEVRIQIAQIKADSEAEVNDDQEGEEVAQNPTESNKQETDGVEESGETEEVAETSGL